MISYRRFAARVSHADVDQKLKPTTKTFLIVSLVTLFAIAGIYIGVRGLVRSGITAGPDKLFGDQHLKTAVALVELHKVRFGAYPSALRELKYTGSWDAIALNRVRYVADRSRTSYYMEVEKGWMGKPELEMPALFWRGTGYNKELRSLLDQ